MIRPVRCGASKLVTDLVLGPVLLPDWVANCMHSIKIRSMGDYCDSSTLEKRVGVMRREKRRMDQSSDSPSNHDMNKEQMK